jgi:hypothetical protein
MAYTPADILEFDRLLARIAKQCYGLPRNFPIEAVLKPVTQCGLGLGSLLSDYGAKAGKIYINCLNDPGRLGAVSRALLAAQAATIGNLPIHELRAESRHYTSLKALSLLHQLGITPTDRASPSAHGTSSPS